MFTPTTNGFRGKLLKTFVAKSFQEMVVVILVKHFFNLAVLGIIGAGGLIRALIFKNPFSLGADNLTFTNVTVPQSKVQSSKSSDGIPI